MSKCKECEELMIEDMHWDGGFTWEGEKTYRNFEGECPFSTKPGHNECQSGSRCRDHA